jgi:hypothetical protein
MADQRTRDDGSPGSRLRNWRPGDDDADELLWQKIADALRDGKSERQIAKLLGVPRSMIWRAKKYSAIPGGLFQRLLDAHVGSKALLYIARYCDDGELPPIEPEHCPHCGHRLRVRSAKGIRRGLDILSKWIEDGRPEQER